MVDKIRLHAAGKLPAEYQPLLGGTHPHAFDARCCRFLRIDYSALMAQAAKGDTDEELFQWACTQGRKPPGEETEIWNAFMQKRGWRDEASVRLRERLQEAQITNRAVQTFFDYIDADEDRPPRFPSDPAPLEESVRGTVVIPGLRSPYERVGGIVHFGRMLDKIRLFTRGRLPPAWVEAKGGAHAFDGMCCRFLQVDYKTLEDEVLKEAGSDDETLEWAFTHGRKPSEEEIEIWNAYLSKRCWRDAYTPRLHFRLQEAGLPVGAALTMFDFIELDEGRSPRFRE
jgi:gluconokinase